MSGDIIFILTVIYVAYTVYSVVGDEKEGVQSKTKPITDIVELKIQSKVTPQSKDVDEKNQQPKLDAVEKPRRVNNPKPVESVKGNKLTAAKIELRTVMMKNPETGEEAKVANNYRMTKRWVKEALVEEGLLDKNYKNKELDDATKIKVAEALSMIKAMDKYKV